LGTTCRHRLVATHRLAPGWRRAGRAGPGASDRNPHTTYQLVRSHLSFLRLKATAEALAEQLDQADGLSHIDFLERLLRVEVDATAARRHASMLRFACFPAPWRIEDFDYAAQPA
jgi:DNA replication protein DnaC